MCPPRVVWLSAQEELWLCAHSGAEHFVVSIGNLEVLCSLVLTKVGMGTL